MTSNIPIISEDVLIQEVDSFVRSSIPRRRFWILSELYIPRVRFSVKDFDRCLVVIYTGVEKFVRMEFLKRSGTVLVQRSENTYDTDSIISQKVKNYTPIQLACQILKSIIIKKSALLGALEIEFSEKELKAQTRITKEILKTLGFENGVFRAKRIITNFTIHVEISTAFFQYLIDLKIIEEALFESVHLNSENLTPLKIIDSREMCLGRFIGNSNIFMIEREEEDRERMIMQAAFNGYVTCRLTDKSVWDHVKTQSVRLNRSVEMKRVEWHKFNMVLHWNRSKCGLWIHMMKFEEEKKYLEVFEKETCGLRWLCKRCCDPFDYWFYRNLPRRIYQEPEWIDSMYRPSGKQESAEFKKAIRDLNRKFKEQEKGESEVVVDSVVFAKVFCVVFSIFVPVFFAFLVLFFV